MASKLNITDEFRTFPFHVSYLAKPIKELIAWDTGTTPQHNPAIIRRDNFWTVGATSYKDKDGKTQDEFEKFVLKYNVRLLDHFEPLYKFYLEWFEFMLRRKCVYMPGMPIPGFHVFKYCKDFEKPLARPHVDVPFDKFDWGKTVGYHTIFTPVIAVEVPEDAGMYVWDVTAEDIDEHGVEKVLQMLPTIEPFDFVGHKPDQMIYHSGRFVHQIKPFSGPTDKWRITMQAHAVLMDGVWNIYW